MGKRDYEVGYARPPKETQFQKGMIANPNGARGKKGEGRPEDIKANEAELWRKVTGETRKVIIDGKPTTMTNRELMLRRMVSNAVAGDVRSIREWRMWQAAFPTLMHVPIRPNGKIIFLNRAASPEVIRDISLEMFVETFGTVPEADRVVIRKYFPSRPGDGFMPDELKQKS